jgi:nucleotide-binding universal stress UspA family protein
VFERILIATDGSKNSEKAAKVGIELAKLSEGKVVIVYVADIGKYMPSAGVISPFGGISSDAIDNIAASIRDAGEKATLQIHGLARSSGVTSERMIVEGNPPNEILRGRN